MLINHPVDYWFSPSPGEDHHAASDMMASMCQYNFFSVDANDACVYSNFLFDISTDPYEKTNLWDDIGYNKVGYSYSFFYLGSNNLRHPRHTQKTHTRTHALCIITLD